MPRLPESFAVLRQRDYRLLAGAHGVSVLGDRIVVVALAFAVLELGGGPSAVGLVFACRSLASVGSLLAGGVVADRLPRRAVMVTADLMRVASQASAAALLISGAAEVWMLAVFAAVSGAAGGFFNPAATGLMPQVVAPELLGQANGLRATLAAAGELAGPVVGGVLVVTVGTGWAFAVDAATFAVSAALLVRLRPPARADRAPTAFLADLVEGWQAFRARTWVWGSVALIAVSNMLWGAWTALGPVVADRSLGGAAVWGTILGCLGAGGLIGGLAATRITPRRPLVVVALGGVVFAVPLGVLASGAPAVAVAASALASGAALMAGNTIWESTIQRHIPPASLSRVSAYDWFGSEAFYPLGLALWGPLATVIGIQTALWVAFGLLAATALALLALREVRELPAYP